MKRLLKKILASALAMVLILAAFSLSTFAKTLDKVLPKDWTGYTPISTSEELESIMDDPYGCYYLTCDINLGSTYNDYQYHGGDGWDPLGKGFTPIPDDIKFQEDLDTAMEKYPAVYVYDEENDGYYTETVFEAGIDYYYLDAFYGVLDGNGHTLEKIYSYHSDSSNGGLFSYNCGIITNITIKHGLFKFAENAGAIAGVNHGIISDCISNTSISNSSSDETVYFGGICGTNYGYISGCSNYSSISGELFVGGIAGGNFGTIRNCTNDSVHIDCIIGNGGIAGVAYGSVITECVDNRAVNTSSKGFDYDTQGYIVGYDLSDESYMNYYRNCFYHHSSVIIPGKNVRAIGNIEDDSVSGGSASVKRITSNMTESTLGAYLDFEYEWVSSYNGRAYPMSSTSANGYAVSSVWNGRVASAFAYGSTGTAEDPYKILTVSQLAYIQKQVMNGETYENTYFLLLNDLEINDVTVECWFKNASEWSPIGDSEHPFLGKFDGGGHTVKGIYFDRPGETEIGLFGYIGEGAVIENLAVEGFTYSCTDSGILVGINDGGTIKNCSASGYADVYMGGALLCGLNGGEIRSCETYGRIYGGVDISGICAYNISSVAECANSAKVFSCAYEAAGISALNLGDISDCINTGNVTAVDIGGGICAYNLNGEIRTSYNTGNIIASSYSGSVCGYTGEVPVENCYYLRSSAKNCIGKIQNGIGAELGLVAADKEGSTTGLTDAQMKLKESFEGFDFVWVWTMLGDETYLYPELRSLIAPPSGDVNGDGSITSVDSNLLKRSIAGIDVEIDKYNGDLSGDRSINTPDSYLLKRKIAGIS